MTAKVGILEQSAFFDTDGFQAACKELLAAQPSLGEAADGSLMLILGGPASPQVQAALDRATEWLNLFVAERHLVPIGEGRFRLGERFPAPKHLNFGECVVVIAITAVEVLLLSTLSAALLALGLIFVVPAPYAAPFPLLLAIVAGIAAMAAAQFGQLITDNMTWDGVYVDFAGGQLRVYPA